MEGFCPSFVTVEGGKLRRAAGVAPSAWPRSLAALPEPRAARAAADLQPPGHRRRRHRRADRRCHPRHGGPPGGPAGERARLHRPRPERGAVLAHVRIAQPGGQVHQGRVEPGEADALLACDPVVAAGGEALATVARGRTRVVANAEPLPTADLVRDPRHRLDALLLIDRLRGAAGPDAVDAVDAHRLALAAVGDAIGANLLLLGYAWQQGLVPLSLRAIERAVELNGVAVEANRTAFTWGRLAAAMPERLADLLGRPEDKHPRDLEGLIAHRRALLAAYQDAAYADRYEAVVREVERAERHLRATAAAARRGGGPQPRQAHGLQGRVRGRPPLHRRHVPHPPARDLRGRRQAQLPHGPAAPRPPAAGQRRAGEAEARPLAPPGHAPPRPRQAPARHALRPVRPHRGAPDGAPPARRVRGHGPRPRRPAHAREPRPRPQAGRAARHGPRLRSREAAHASKPTSASAPPCCTSWRTRTTRCRSRRSREARAAAATGSVRSCRRARRSTARRSS